MAVDEGGLQRGDVDGIANGKVHGGVDHVAEGLLVVLNRSSLTVVVSKEDKLLLLASPKGTDTLTIYLKSIVTT